MTKTIPLTFGVNEMKTNEISLNQGEIMLLAMIWQRQEKYRLLDFFSDYWSKDRNFIPTGKDWHRYKSACCGIIYNEFCREMYSRFTRDELGDWKPDFQSIYNWSKNALEYWKNDGFKSDWERHLDHLEESSKLKNATN